MKLMNTAQKPAALTAEAEKLISDIEKFTPWNDQERQDKGEFLRRLKSGEQLFTRENTTAHLTVCGWVVSPDRKQVLMVHHNLWKSWSWIGGHVDGDKDLLYAARREVMEETGLKDLKALSEEIFSLEILAANGHEKKGKYVSSHLHLNVTYLFEADTDQAVQVCPGENTGVKWFAFEDALEASGEEWYQERVYRKLNQKMLEKQY